MRMCVDILTCKVKVKVKPRIFKVHFVRNELQDTLTTFGNLQAVYWRMWCLRRHRQPHILLASPKSALLDLTPRRSWYSFSIHLVEGEEVWRISIGRVNVPKDKSVMK